MKKLLVSDYDGTFKNDKDGSIKANIDEVSKFMSNGNIFTLASARSYNSLIRQVNKYNIPYDYLICNNGGVVYDKNGNIIFFHPVLNSTLLKTLKYINKIGLLKRVLFRDFYGNVTTDLNEIYDIVCNINMSNLDKINDIKDELNFLCSTPFFHILVFSEEMDKIDGIDVVVSSECIDDKHVFTIGNDFFDRNMIEKYNGYRMINSNILLRKNGIRKVSSVRRLIRSI